MRNSQYDDNIQTRTRPLTDEDGEPEAIVSALCCDDFRGKDSDVS